MGIICALRKIKESDLEQLRLWRNSEFVRSKMISREEISKSEQIRWFENRDESIRLDFIIEDKNGNSIGSAYLFDIDQKHKHAEWGFYLGSEDFTKGGYALEAMILLYKYGFEELNLKKVYCRTLSSNPKVVQLHKTFGLNQEGILKNHYLLDNQWVDVHFMSLFKTEYQKKCEKIEKLISRFYV